MKQARVLNEGELKRALALIDAGKHAARNRLAVLLSHYAGLRVGEIASLKWSNVVEVDHTVKTVFYLDAENTKSNEARAVHLNQLLQKEICRHWLALDEYRCLSQPVILSQRSKAFSANTLCQLFTKLYQASARSDGALIAAEKDAERLERMFRARHPDGVMAITAEADIKRVDEVKDGLFRSTKWRRGLDSNQVVYLVHFHGVGYAPGVLPNEMQYSFIHTPSGKKSKFYAGSNQVRCIALYEKSEDDKSQRDDIGNCFRYAVKCHYRPPSKKRMLELAPQWLLLTHMMQYNKKLTRTVGLRKPIKVNCDECDAVHDHGRECACRHQTDSTIVFDLIKKLKVDSSLILPSNIVHDPTVYLNCPTATSQNTWENRQEKKKRPIFRYVGLAAMQHQFHGHMPVGP